ncbi:MAG: hypothetical protein IJC58_03750 [Oscillospiraceae bacterium]|nr:hypothetical protein [Oscillospiraceae bacterium]
MSKQNNKKAKMAKSNQSVNNTLKMLIVGCLAECYLLLAYNFFAHGTVQWIVTLSKVFGVLRYVGLAAAVVCAVLAFCWKSEKKKKSYALWGVGVSLFLAVTSFLMIAYYPAATDILCVVVPLLMLFGVVCLLYPRDFTVSVAALAIALADLWLLRRSYMMHPTILTVLTVGAIVVVAAAFVLVMLVKKNGGLWICKKNKVRVFSKNCNYGIMLAAIVVSAAAMAVSLAVFSAAFYVMWALGVVLFALAVYYTVKQV